MQWHPQRVKGGSGADLAEIKRYVGHCHVHSSSKVCVQLFSTQFLEPSWKVEDNLKSSDHKLNRHVFATGREESHKHEYDVIN